MLAGYDGSSDAADAIGVGARVLPALSAQIVYLWAPPSASLELPRQLVRKATSVDALAAMLEREGEADAERVAADGVALARAAGWRAEPLVRRSYGGEASSWLGWRRSCGPRPSSSARAG